MAFLLLFFHKSDLLKIYKLVQNDSSSGYFISYIFNGYIPLYVLFFKVFFKNTLIVLVLSSFRKLSL